MTTQTTQYDLDMMKAMASLFRKKAAVMAALAGGMVKKGENKHFDYKFMTASDIKQTVSRLFAEHGLSLQMSGVSTQDVITQVEVKDYQTKSTRVKEVSILRIQFSISLCDVDTGAVQESFWFGEAAGTDDKAASKAATSALKYFLISNLLIADRDEDKRDTDAEQPRKKRPQEHVPAPIDLPTAAPTKAAPPTWWGVLGEYKPFMPDQDFMDMREAMSSQAKQGLLILSNDNMTRAHIEKVYGLFIDTDALRAARKEAI